MIKELRIGNYIHHDDNNGYISIQKVLAINNTNWLDCKKEYWIETDCLEGESPKDFYPIPLTEQWLIDFGFKKRVLHDTVTEYYKNRLTITYLKVYNSFETTFKGFVIDNKHVHQLQNLYFALRGEELKKGETK